MIFLIPSADMKEENKRFNQSINGITCLEPLGLQEKIYKITYGINRQYSENLVRWENCAKKCLKISESKTTIKDI